MKKARENLAAAAGVTTTKIHGHHIVQKTTPQQYTGQIAAATAVNPAWTRSEKAAWYVGKSQQILSDAHVPLLDDMKLAEQMAKAKKPLYNLTWAVNGNGTHALETIEAVWKRLDRVKAGGQAAVEEELIEIGKKLSAGEKLY